MFKNNSVYIKELISILGWLVVFFPSSVLFDSLLHDTLFSRTGEKKIQLSEFLGKLVGILQKHHVIKRMEKQSPND